MFVLLHGIGLSSRSYDRLVPELEKTGGRVFSIDLPGFGSLPAPGSTVSVELHARFVASMLDELRLPPCVIVGHSMGAQFATELAAIRPDLVAAVVLIGPVVDPRRPKAWQQGLSLVRDSVREPLATNAMVFTQYLRCGPRWYLQELGPMLGYDTLRRVPDVAAPVLVLRGEHDPIAREPWCADLAQAAQHGESATIAGHRHVVIHSAPTDVADAIAAFLDGSPPQEAGE